MGKTLRDILDPNARWRERVEERLHAYEELYGLARIENEEKISPSLYQYCIKGRYFVVILLYNNERKFFVQRDFSKQAGKWELVGGWLKEDELFDQALDRIVQKETSNSLVEAVPIAVIKNRFVSTEGKVVEHYGVGFLGRLRRDDTPTQNGVFRPEADCELNGRDAKMLELGAGILKHKIIEPPLDEVDSHAHSSVWHKIHNVFVKPVSYWGSSRLLQNAVYAKSVEIGKDGERTILDVACGDDRTILRLGTRARLAVANDIARDSMKHLIAEANPSNIIFTNENLLELELRKKFDVVICKNVMHHMRNPDEVEMLLKKLRELGQRIIIMDVENPRTSFLGSLWNKYYVKMLHDHGGLFMSFNQLEEMLHLFYKDCSISCSRISTIKGKYMLAVIDCAGTNDKKGVPA